MRPCTDAPPSHHAAPRTPTTAAAEGTLTRPATALLVAGAEGSASMGAGPGSSTPGAGMWQGGPRVVLCSTLHDANPSVFHVMLILLCSTLHDANPSVFHVTRC